MQKQIVGFRATEEQRQKLELLALGEATTITGVLVRLIDRAPVSTVEVKRNGLVLRENANSDVIRQDTVAVCA